MILWRLPVEDSLQFQHVINFVVPLSIFEAQWSSKGQTVALTGHFSPISHHSCSLDSFLVRRFGSQLSPRPGGDWAPSTPSSCSGGAEEALEASPCSILPWLFTVPETPFLFLLFWWDPSVLQDWQPPFACDVDKLHFTPRIQRLNELEVNCKTEQYFCSQMSLCVFGEVVSELAMSWQHSGPWTAIFN